MKVKKYVVDSMPDALQKIRSELGKDAVIINTKEIRVGGILGMFAKKKIEVIAGTDSNPEPRSPQAAAPRRSPAAMPAAANQPFSHPAVSPEPRAGFSVPAPQPTRTALLTEQPEEILERATKLSEPAVYAARTASAPSAVREDVLLEEMKQMKDMMRKIVGSGAQGVPIPKLPEPFERLKAVLIEHEVRPEIAQSLIDAAMGDELNDDVSEAEAQAAVKLEILKLLNRQSPEPILPDTRIAHFVGPTGVGKTTSIAKLAAEQVLKHRRKAGFITSDTYRIAAVEQLKTYANILNIPLEVVFSPLDLPKAYEKLKDCDIIFMDTAGRNFRNEMYVSELNTLLQSETRRETYLVLSLSMKYNDMKAITNNFSKFGLHKVLFTKADETVTFGSVVNLLHDFPLSLSYITDGQNVPDDIRPINAEMLADRLVEEPQHE